MPHPSVEEAVSDSIIGKNDVQTGDAANVVNDLAHGAPDHSAQEDSGEGGGGEGEDIPNGGEDSDVDAPASTGEARVENGIDGVAGEDAGDAGTCISGGGSAEAGSQEHAAPGSSEGLVVHKPGDGPQESGAGGGVPQGALGSLTGTPAGPPPSLTPKTRLPEGWLECAACGDVVAVGGGGRGGRGPACAGFIPIKV